MIQPKYTEPFFESITRLDEYTELKEMGLAPKIRAWIREADKVIRANNALRSP